MPKSRPHPVWWPPMRSCGAAVISAVGGRSLDGAAYPPEKQRRIYGIPKPGGRHRAMPDVEVTAQVLIPPG
ncbi:MULTISPECIES: hypothetical protein [Streptomyces]|uniref:hypothetical protein n=1 Tax=Streptomyces TaxID=1883 RepID=UPI00117EA2C6|nr:hypothetical protein [Streptomyces viridochromogenes]